MTNTGNVSLTDPVLTDPFATTGPTLTGGDTDADGVLDVGETWTYTATHAVTQAEIDAGAALVNSATIDTDQTAPQTDDATTTIVQTPKLTIDKTSPDLTFTTPGEVLHYDYLVTNSGNVTVDGPFTVADDKAIDESARRRRPAWRPASRSPAARPTP